MRKKMLAYIFIVVLSLSLVGCTQNGRTTEEMDTGAWESGTVYYNGYRIDIEGPKVGHPSGDSLWSTYYTDENEKDVDVDFYGIEGSLEDRVEELEAEEKEVFEGVLWGNACHFYIDGATIAMIPLGEDGYLQVKINHEDDELVESTRVPTAFTLAIEKER